MAPPEKVNLPSSSKSLRKPVADMVIGDDVLEILCVSEENSKETCHVSPDSSVADLLDQLVPGHAQQYVIEAFGKVYREELKVSDIVKANNSSTFLLSSSARPHPVKRDHFAGASDEKLERRTNEIIKMHWNTFNHNTVNLFAYAANLQSPAPPTSLPTRAGPPSYASVAATNLAPRRR